LLLLKNIMASQEQPGGLEGWGGNFKAISVKRQP